MSSGSLYDNLKYFVTYLKDIGRKQIEFKVIMFINSILFNSLLSVYLLLLVFSRIHVWVLMCIYACADTWMCECMWRLEVNLRCCSSELSTVCFKTRIPTGLELTGGAKLSPSLQHELKCAQHNAWFIWA